MKFELSEEQYYLISFALENYYEICREDGEHRHLAREIEDLGEYLHDQKIKNENEVLLEGKIRHQRRENK